MNLALWLQRAAQVHGARAAIAHGVHAVLDYAAFVDAAARAATALRAAALVPGERVGLFASNGPDYLVAMWGAWWAGLVVVPMNARLHAREAAWILGHSGARLCIADPAHAALLAPELGPEVALVDDLGLSPRR